MLNKWLVPIPMAILPVVVLGSVVLTSLRTSAQPVNNQTRKPSPLFVGMAECARCHREPNKDEPAPLLCRCNEVQIWETQDKHRIAHLVLRNDRSVQMGKLLGIEDPSSDKRCVTCHGVIIADEKLRHRSFPPERAIQEGVTCVVCHGAYKDWIDLHGGIDRETWRTFPRQRKEEEFGMNDLWDPVRRAQLCVSCHVGDPAQGRLVTHAMYAAGHPLLPAFELVAYSDAMPRHWQYLSEKPDYIRALLEITDDQARFERTRTALFGALVAFRQSQQILLQVTSSFESQQSLAAWPDFLHFDCYGCHRPLRRDHWRSDSAYAKLHSGRPGWRSWPAQILAIRPALPPSTQPLHDNDPCLTLHDAFRATLFGDPRAIHSTASTNLRHCDQLLAALKSTRMNNALLIQFLSALSDPKTVPAADFDSARHRLWLLKALYHEVHPKPRNQHTIDDLLQKLSAQLQLEPSPATAEGSSDVAQAAGQFHPESLQNLLSALHSALQQMGRE